MSNLLVQTIKHTNNTTAMSVDSSGRVQFENKPAYHVYYSTGGGGDGLTGVIAWNAAKLNVGTMCNLSTGVATIPVAGIYHLYFHALGTNDSGGAMADDLHIRIETSTDSGSNYTGHMIGLGDHSTAGTAGYIGTSASVTLDLAAGTLVRNRVSAQYTYVENTEQPYSYAGGFLIG
tara:strand:- start:242 stop:769 length:528 start_codon:yes stop_codon:yes gene_type:complete